MNANIKPFAIPLFGLEMNKHCITENTTYIIKRSLMHVHCMTETIKELTITTGDNMQHFYHGSWQFHPK